MSVNHGKARRALKFPSFEEYNNKSSIFSGNLDARKIDEILQKYGINKIINTNRSKLLYIKNKRNKLAHGEISYVEACRDKAIDEIILYKNSVKDIIHEIIESADTYIGRKLYVAPSV